MASTNDKLDIEFREPPERTLSDDPWPAGVRDALAPVTDAGPRGAVPPPGATTVLITGAIGAGKTYLANALLGEVGLPVLDVPAYSAFDDSATEVQELVFEEAFEASPCAVLFDDFGEFGGRTFSGLETVLARNLERVSTSSEVLVVATTDDVANLQRSLKRPGRFDVLCPLEIPDAERRAHVFDAFLAAVEADVAVTDEERRAVVDATAGFSPADVGGTVRRAAAAASVDGGTLTVDHLERAVEGLERDLARDPEAVSELFGDDSFDSYYAYEENLVREDDGDEPLELGWDFGDGGDDSEPSHMAIQHSGNVPAVSYDDIGGLADAKRVLREAIEWPTTHPELCEQMDLDISRGILLYGPPGNGKTMLAKAIAHETDSQFISVKGPEVMDKYVGESQKFVDRLFETARRLAPSIVFVDEIDSITDERGGGGIEKATDRVVNQLLLELDGLDELSDVVVIGATNRRDIIDEAIRRPGRLGKEVHVPPPDEEAAREIFAVHLEDRPVEADVSLEWLVERTENGVSGAEIAGICEEAARAAMRRSLGDDVDDVDDGDPTTVEEADVRIGVEDFETAFDLGDDPVADTDVTAFQ